MDTERDKRPEPIPLPLFLQAPGPEARTHAAGTPLWASLWVQAPLLAVLLAADASLGFFTARRFHSKPVLERAPYSLSLRVVQYGDNLHLLWNRTAPALTGAQGGALWITDGEQNRTVELTPAQLLNGSVTYRRITGRVKFRLEVFLKDKRSVSGVWELDQSQPESRPPGRR